MLKSAIIRRFASMSMVTILVTGTLTSTAQASERRRNDDAAGAAIAIGVGAAILGAVLANQKSRSRDDRSVRHERDYGHAPKRHHERAVPPRHHRQEKPYINDGH